MIMESSDRDLQQVKLFHSIDRTIYARLVLVLGFHPDISKYIVAFWYLIERYIAYNFMVEMILLDDSSFNALAHEPITILYYLCSDHAHLQVHDHPLFIDIDSQLPMLRSLVRALVAKEFSIRFVFEDKEFVKRSMEGFVNDVCENVFSDIIPPYPYLVGNTMDVGTSPNLLTNGGLVLLEGYILPSVLNEQVDHNIVDGKYLLPPQEACEDNIPDDNQYQPNVAQNDRTLFLTFSKGHPLSTEELKAFFSRNFGDCVEAIYMRAEANSQALFARVVVTSPSDMINILGDKEKAEFSIHGKDVRVRRFLARQNKQGRNQD